MRIGVIGTGNVGSALRAGWTKSGHEVRVASRSSELTPKVLADWAEVIVLAVPWAAVEEVASAIEPAGGRIVIDCTNPIAMTAHGPGLAIGHDTSGGERLQARLPQARVVKTLNQVGAETMANTSGYSHPPVQLLAGDDELAKTAAAGLLTDLGFQPLDAGGIAASRLLEPFAMVWITQAMMRGKGRNWAFAAIERDGPHDEA